MHRIMLGSIEGLYPGLKERLDNNGLSVQAQDHCPLRTDIGQRGEQTFNRDPKTDGGIKRFSNDGNFVLRWTLNRFVLEKNTTKLFDMANFKTPGDIYKFLRPSFIWNNFMELLQHKSKSTSILSYIISSGMPIEEDLSDGILNTLPKGEN